MFGRGSVFVFALVAALGFWAGDTAQAGPGGHGMATMSVETDGFTPIQLKKSLSASDRKRLSLAFKRVSQMRKRFGAKHPNYAQALFDLGKLYERLGQAARARRHYELAYNIWRMALGVNHPRTRLAQTKLKALAKKQKLKMREKARTLAKPAQPRARAHTKKFSYEVPPSTTQRTERRRAYKKPAPKTSAQRQAPVKRSLSPNKLAKPSPSTAQRSATPPPAINAPAPPTMMRKAARPPQPMETMDDQDEVGTEADAPFTTVRVFYATDRNNTGSRTPGRVYGIERARLQYGICDVSIPRDHRMGELEAPSIWRLEFSENPERHVVLLKVLQQDKDVFFGDMRRRVRKSKDGAAFLFVHGYNTTFEHAARRTAQMTYDLGFDGAPVFYSWPSQGTTRGYTIDENNIAWTEPHLKNFVADFVERSRAKKIFLVAHSMGTRALTKAVSALAAEDPSVKNKIEAIILAAPDIDADIFKRDILPRMNGAAKNLTLYASAKDNALLASKQIHGYPRAGDAGEGLIVAEGLDTIDASDVDTSLIGHAYFAEAKSIISDLFAILNESSRAEDRDTLKAVRSPDGTYWRFR